MYPLACWRCCSVLSMLPLVLLASSTAKTSKSPFTAISSPYSTAIPSTHKSTAYTSKSPFTVISSPYSTAIPSTHKSTAYTSKSPFTAISSPYSTAIPSTHKSISAATISSAPSAASFPHCTIISPPSFSNRPSTAISFPHSTPIVSAPPTSLSPSSGHTPPLRSSPCPYSLLSSSSSSFSSYIFRSSSFPSSSSSSIHSSSLLGAIVGCIIGVVVIVVIIVIATVILLIRHKTIQSKMIYDMEEKIKSPIEPSPNRIESSHTILSPQTISIVQDDVEHMYCNVDKIAPTIMEFPTDSDVMEGEEVVLNVYVTGYPKPSFTWYHNGSMVTTDHSFTLVEDGSLVIHTAEMKHAGVYELKVANELGIGRCRVAIGVYGSEMQLPGDYQMITPAMTISMFGPYVSKNHEQSNMGFNIQYRSLEPSAKSPSTVATSAENKALNRFANILPYDSSLIQLSPMEGQTDCQREYINASYIAGYREPKKFIATQGPLSNTVVDLWRLVWQEGVPSIVMVTNIKEDGKVKCHQYWPESGHQKYGPFTVSIIEQTSLSDYVIRNFEIMLLGSDAPQKVTQFHYTAWPDHGVPENGTSLLAFHRKVKTQHDGSKGPLLVHCSAGVGRTGTLIAIDIVLDQMEEEGVVDIPGSIRKMRQQRMKMVQTPDQYIFLHDAILEYVMCGDTQVQVSDILTSLTILDKKDPMTGLTGMESQFEILGHVSPDPKSVHRNVAMQESGKNRSMDYLPPDRSRVILKQGYPDYINACFVNGYKHQKAFIIAQGPLKSTCSDFWKMVLERNCGTIVMLSQLQEGGKEVCHQYWPDQGPQKYNEFTVETSEQETCDGYIKRTFMVTDKSAKVQEVTQFHITNWSPDGVCANLATITEVIEELDKVQRRTGNHPIVVHCSDTVGRSGMFCAITMVTQQCKTEGVMDVFQTVKAIRTQKPGSILTVDQYKAIYKTILVFVDSFNNYSNFKT